MRYLTKFFAIIYKSYDEAGMDIPHFRAMSSIVFLLFLQLINAVLLFNLDLNKILVWDTVSKNGMVQYLVAASYFVVPILLLATIFNKKRLYGISVSYQQAMTAGKILKICFAISIVLMIILMIRHGVRKDTIHF